jgi:hypothetical protein
MIEAWTGLSNEQKAEIAIELLSELIKDAEGHIDRYGDYSDDMTKKSLKRMKYTRSFLEAYYGLYYGHEK